MTAGWLSGLCGYMHSNFEYLIKPDDTVGTVRLKRVEIRNKFKFIKRIVISGRWTVQLALRYLSSTKTLGLRDSEPKTVPHRLLLAVYPGQVTGSVQHGALRTNTARDQALFSLNTSRNPVK